ncbi:MAG: hypothetical protein IJI96_02650 [Methanobrevibacter sp.]|nr:hypothetical protein [Methanobrevibacter sp.]MBQ6627406.1 hypothetical protein [Methanobrevibacter sp.]
MIEEYHTCGTCEWKFPVPTDPNFQKWELACSKKRKEVNPSGGLTKCPIWKEEI